MSIYRGRSTRDVYLANLLYDAIDDEDINSINTFLLKGADCNLVLPKRGISPFHLVIGKESEETATNLTILFLQNRADPNVRSDDGLTPLHIAAAYGRSKILHGLLCCGGNPDLRDVNYKKPIDYAHEYGHKDCLDLLLSFMERPNIFSRNEINPAFNFTLEKIVVENGGSTGDYEIVQEYKTEPLTRKNLESLHQLPETDSAEYVMKWCQSHLQISNVPVPLVKPTDGPENSCNTSDFRESSFDESEDGRSVNYLVKHDKITFRKKYRKMRKVTVTPRKGDISRENIENKIASDSSNASVTKDETNLGLITTLREFSRESGILTLPHSKSEFYDVIDKVDSVSADPDVKISPQNILNDNTLANSSDFRTCSPCNDTAGHYTTCHLNRNILEVTNDVSQLTVDGARSRKSSAKSDGVCSTDISFVSVSEVYKYIDDDEGIVLYEKRLLKAGTSDYSGSVISSSKSSKLSSLPASAADYDTDTLRKELTNHGYNPGPITFTTKRIYLRKLKQIKKHPLEPIITQQKERVYSLELEKTLRDPNWVRDTALYKSLEEVLVKDFANPNPTRKWREGVNKTSFTYLLMDPRITNNLPCRAELMDTKEIWEVFLSSIFYVGKGKRSRPYSHLYEAVNLWKEEKKNSPNKKLNQILNIWNENSGVICLHIFQNVIPVEAYTREAAIISALKIENLKNIKSGEFYGTVSTWTQKQKKLLGVYLLHKAMMIFINEGERQLCPKDIE